MTTIEGNQVVIADLQQILKDREEQSQTLEDNFSVFKDSHDLDLKRYHGSKADLLKKKSTLSLEIQCINEDYRAAFDKKTAMHQEIIETKDAIKDIQVALSTREEEILRIRIKIRQADMERERLEQESQALRRQIGKITRGK